MEQSLQRSGRGNEMGRERGNVAWGGWALAMFYFMPWMVGRYAF